MSKAEDKRFDELFEYVQKELSFEEAVKVFDFLHFMTHKLTMAKAIKVSELVGVFGGKDNE